ncbi:MAG: N-acetylneuraminate synthase family protein [Anaerolineae bacterium]|jgi:3-deoxy-7-phosphoheptulonate synthase
MNRNQQTGSVGASVALLERGARTEATRLYTAPIHLLDLKPEPDGRAISCDGITIGGHSLMLTAGLCRNTPISMLDKILDSVTSAGFQALHAGCFVPNPPAHNDPGIDAGMLAILGRTCKERGLALIIEIISPEDIELAGRYATILQIGARNMQNYPLLHAAGTSDKPVLLKRGTMSTLAELCSAADYIRSRGNQRVILCERGIRTFEVSAGDTFDISAIPALRELTQLPVIADPCHGSGEWTHVGSMCKAAVAAGADGLIVNICPATAQGRVDQKPTVPAENLQHLVLQLRAIADAVGREL